MGRCETFRLDCCLVDRFEERIEFGAFLDIFNEFFDDRFDDRFEIGRFPPFKLFVSFVDDRTRLVSTEKIGALAERAER